MEEGRDSEIKKLVLAKMLYLYGCTHAARKDEVSRMLAIHNFDNAIEMVLSCVAIKRDIRPPGNQFNFEDYLKALDLPFKEQVRGLHRLRNAVQHQGDVPSIENINKYRGYAEAFLTEVIKEVFGIPYEELFLCQLIENENLRRQMLEAEKAFGEKKYRRCIELCDDTLIAATFEEGDVFQSAGLLTGYWGASEEFRKVLHQDYLEKYKQKEYFELAKELRGAILQWGQAATGMQFLDEYRTEFLEHRKVIEALDDLSDKELKGSAGSSLRFVVSLVLKWQTEGILS